ncbi:P-loop NTPase fold protein [Alkalihalobacillus sp. NPDC078783]
MIYSNLDVSTDVPIKSQKEDCYDRQNFSYNIARILIERTNKSCLVFGIHGEWGEGKTSVINMIKDELSRVNNTLIIDFNPWRYEEEDALLALFYKELADKIGNNLPDKFKNIFDKYLKLVTDASEIFGLGTLGKAVNGLYNLIPNYELIDFRKHVEEAIKKFDKKIIIVIDDIDRLENKEILRILKLVKLNADIEGLSYIVSFDRNIVAHSINDDIEKGEKYIEKIIQVQVDIPKARSNDLFNVLFSEMSFLFNRMDAEQVKDFKNKYRKFFENYLKNPRQIPRLINILNFSSRQLEGEVNLKDLIVLESIKVFHKKLYTYIKNNKNLFFDSRTILSRYNSDRQNDLDREFFQEFFYQFNQYEQNNIEDLITYLFPYSKYLFNVNDENRIELKISSTQKRLSSFKYFDRYFSYSVDKEDLSDIEIDILIKSLDGNSIEKGNKLETYFLNLESGNRKKRLFEKIDEKYNEYDDTLKRKLLDYIIDMQDHFTMNDGLVHLYSNTISNISLSGNKGLFENTFKKILQVNDIYIRVLVFSYMFKRDTMFESVYTNRTIDKDFIDQCKIELFENLRVIDIVKIDEKKYDLTYFLYCIKNIDQEYFSIMMNVKLENSYALIEKLLAMFPGSDSSTDKDKYNALSEYVDTKHVYKILISNFNDITHSSNINNFMKMHRKIVNE